MRKKMSCIFIFLVIDISYTIFSGCCWHQNLVHNKKKKGKSSENNDLMTKITQKTHTRTHTNYKKTHISCRTGHMQNPNLLQYRYLYFYFIHVLIEIIKMCIFVFFQMSYVLSSPLWSMWNTYVVINVTSFSKDHQQSLTQSSGMIICQWDTIRSVT